MQNGLLDWAVGIVTALALYQGCHLMGWIR